MRTWALNKWCHFVPHSLLSVAGILQFPFVRYFTRIPWIFRSVSVSVAGNQMALGSVLLCVLRHTIMTSPTCALTQLFVPDNHRQGCQRRHLKLNTCVRRNFKHTNFKLFSGYIDKVMHRRQTLDTWQCMYVTISGKMCTNKCNFAFQVELLNPWMQRPQTPFQGSGARLRYIVLKL